MSHPSELTADVQALKSKGAFKRLYKATVYASQGVRAAWHYEAAFRTELVLALTALALVCVTPFSTMQRIALMACWVLVIVVELLNSAIEAVVDLASPNLHTLAGRAKDMGSAAVLISIALTMAVWATIAVPVWWGMLTK